MLKETLGKIIVYKRITRRKSGAAQAWQGALAGHGFYQTLLSQEEFELI